MQRNSKIMSFSPIIPEVTKRVLGLDQRTVKIISQNMDPEPGQPRGFLADIHDIVNKDLGPGQYLNDLSCEASEELRLQLCEFASSLNALGGQQGPVDLLLWIRRFVTFGTARYLFGPENPLIREPELEEAFWAFDHGLGWLMLGMFPSITAAGAYRGREKMVVALMKYHEEGLYKTASKIVRDRVQVEEQYGFSRETIARSALSFLFAGIVNTTTTTFWLVLRMFADAKLLATVRSEIERALETSKENVRPDTLSIGAVKDGCPTLMAVFRETLRIGSENFSVRHIKEDVMLGDRFLLKKDSVVQIAGGVIHADKSIWGDDVDDFAPGRFLTQKAKGGGIHPAAFRGFGGGKTLCPGRHFALNEIVVFAALIVYGFEMTGPDGGKVDVPPKNDGVLPVHVLEPHPKNNPKVMIRLREEAELLDQLEIVM